MTVFNLLLKQAPARSALFHLLARQVLVTKLVKLQGSPFINETLIRH